MDEADAMAGIRSLYDWLAEARARPGMFVHGRSLAELESQCLGWSAAVDAHGIDDPGRDFNRRFRDWLRTTQGLSAARGWADAITRQCEGDADAAWPRFFEHLDAFQIASD